MSHNIRIKEVGFFGGNDVRLSGELYMTEDLDEKLKAPAIVLCQGLSGEKHKVLPLVATAFASAGYVVLAFDYGGCGQSEDRRNRPYLFPAERVEDALCAIAYAAQLPCVDLKRIGLYGISYGGPVAIYAAAYERRVKCVTVVSGPGNGPDLLASLMEKFEWEQLLKAIEEDRACRVTTGQSKLVPITQVIKFPKSFWERYALLDSSNESESLPTNTGNTQAPMLSLESADAMMRLLPKTVVHMVSPRPILFVHGEKDDVAKIELARELYEKGDPPKEFVALPDMDHIDLDTGEGLNRQVALSLQWFDRHLK
ncbi:MAG: alpha/beta fold hydrolase [Candidatus Theseobacter exili]|nr:alpha/beta fold hydrolase [Candidatus Theseobacter exili]